MDYTATVASHRAVRVVLALEAWKLKHGSLPKSLAQLVGPYLDRLPIDPYTGESFPVLSRRDRAFSTLGTIVLSPQHTHQYAVYLVRRGLVALAWNRDPTKARNVLEKYQVYTGTGYQRGEWHTPQSEYDVWESGWPFPIP